MDITVTPFDVSDDVALERAYEIHSTTIALDVPGWPPVCRTRFIGGMRHPMPGDAYHLALAYLDGTPVGLAKLELPQLENTENAGIEINVLPAYRRRGIGRALYDYAVRYVRDQGRKRVYSMTVTALPDGPPWGEEPGTRFAEAMGAKSALIDVWRRMQVEDVDQGKLDELLAGAYTRAEGYSLVRWTGPAPEEYVNDIAYLEGRLIQDAPMGDLEWEPPKVDGDRIRGYEAGIVARGRRQYHTGARHDASGRLVAWTTLDFGASSQWHAFQQITIVDPRHRGHRLGTVVKIENLRYVLGHEPQLRTVDTFNAAANDHMISINEAMGFRAMSGWHNWQVTL